MINRELIYRKLAKLTEYLNELRPLTEYGFEQYQTNSLVTRTAERFFMSIIEVAPETLIENQKQPTMITLLPYLR